ncbi:MAG: antirestriction protein ArdA [Eubacteriales bacterium]
MRFILYSEQTQRTTEAEFPATGKELQNFCDQLGIQNNAKAEARVEAVNYLYHNLEEDGDKIFCGKTFVLDEMNFLAKQLSLMSTPEIETFGAVVSEYDYSMQEMIELTENTHNMEVAYNKPDLVAVASKLYLEQNFKLKPEDVNFTEEDASKFLCDYGNGQASKITHDGKLLYQTEVFEHFFTGKSLPYTSYDCGAIAVDLTVFENKQGERGEILYLPYHESELEKILERMGITEESQLEKVELRIYDCDVDQRLENFLKEQPMTFGNLAFMNQVTEGLGDLYQQNSKELAKFMEMTKISSLQDLATLSENLQELTFHRNVESPSEYAELLLDDALDFNDSARDYIDFDGFGQAKLENLDHCFTEGGLLIYHGNDFEMEVIMEIADSQNQEMGGMVT